MKLFIGLLTLIFMKFSTALPADISYTNQGIWPGICTTGNRQSPINIITEDAESGDLTALKFNSLYDYPLNGEFENTCQNVEFTPDSNTLASPLRMITPDGGEYQLKQFHFHWGRGAGEGTEHLVDGVAEEFEIHFVHERDETNLDLSAGNALSVVSVRGEAYNEPIMGIFAKLNASMITRVNAKIDIQNIIITDLFPSNRDYHYYEGSLTTPNCDETVQWYVFKDLIRVPYTYLQELRKIQKDTQGNLLAFNVRDTQDINNRRVLYYSVDDDEVSVYLYKMR